MQMLIITRTENLSCLFKQKSDSLSTDSLTCSPVLNWVLLWCKKGEYPRFTIAKHQFLWFYAQNTKKLRSFYGTFKTSYDSFNDFQNICLCFFQFILSIYPLLLKDVSYIPQKTNNTKAKNTFKWLSCLYWEMHHKKLCKKLCNYIIEFMQNYFFMLYSE